ncbi:MAG TPA: OsmC family protein [Candidatus Limnocylindria bacterium]|nr:OsmC family protein [Candidatus Limnocylindria bacterium]
MPTRIRASVDPERSRTEARTARGHAIVMDADPPYGDDSAAGPKETMLAALAGCTAMDVASILRKKRQTAATYELDVTAESADEHPKVYTNIVVLHRLTGDVAPEALRRSIELSATQYCPVNAMMSAVSRIEHRYHLTDAAGAVHEARVAVVGPNRAVLVG